MDDNSVEELSGYERIEAISALIPTHSDETKILLARALHRKGKVLGELHRGEEALTVYDEILRRFGQATELLQREIVAKALFNKGVTLGDLNRSADTLAVYDEVVRRFSEATELTLREPVAKALGNKGFSLGYLNRKEEALAVYEEVLHRFGEATEPSLRECVDIVLGAIGAILLPQAKQAWANGKESEARQILLTAQEKIIASLERRPNEPFTLGNHAYIKFLLGEKEQARELLTKAIALGGEEMLEAELKAASLHPLPQDEEFRALVQSIPLPEAQSAATKPSEVGLAPKSS